MPTIDQLAPAVSASDGDEFIVSQGGVARKVTRAQVLSGVQPQLNVPAGTLLGGVGSGIGSPEAVTIGANLVLNGSTLSATAASFSPALLPSGLVPQAPDLIAISQNGTNVAVSYQQLLNGISGASNVDVSQATIKPAGATSASPLSTVVGGLLPLSGGTLTGTLSLTTVPILASHAATKGYVDGQVATTVPLAGGSMLGTLSLSGPPLRAADAATKAYVDGTAAMYLPTAGGSLSGAVSLAGDPTGPLQATTKQYADLKVARSGDTLTGPLTLSADPTTSRQAATKNYVDTRTASTLPLSGGTMAGALFLAGDPVLSGQAATKQYADQRVLRSGDTLTGTLTLAGDPSQAFHAASKNYVDGRFAAAVAASGASMSGALLLASDPAVPLQAATKQYADLKLSRNGDTMSGALVLAGAPTVPLHAATKQYVDGQIASAVPLSGGSMTGVLSLSAAPTSPMHAATKSYVDANPTRARVINVCLPPYNAKLDGVTDDTAAFKAAYLAAPAGSVIYVPNGTTVLQSPSSWGIALTKQVKWIVDGTQLPDGTQLGSSIPNGGGPAGLVLPGLVAGNSKTTLTTSQGASQATDFAVQQSSYLVNHNGGASSVIANSRTDTIIYNSPANFIWNGLDRLVWAGTQTPAGSPAAQHVGRYIQTVRQSSGPQGQQLPQPELWAACLEFHDATGQPSSATGASLTVEMDWFGNGLDDANARTIQSLVVGQVNTSGAPVEIGSVIGVWLSAGSAGSAKKIFSINLPFSAAVLDTTNAQSINNAPVLRMAAGQSIAFEGSNSNRLLYDSGTNTLRFNQGTMSYPVGKGITVGWENVYSASATLPSYISGNIIFLVGTSSYTITLPPANTVAAGTGFTFSVLGAGPVAISPSGQDTIDTGNIQLHTSDRYHIVSDGVSAWREIFWTNAVSPRFLGPLVLASYRVGSLPLGQSAGAKAFATDGRKPGEGAGAGTGVEVFFDGQHWISVCSGTSVAA